MGVRNGMLYHILGLLSVLAFVYMSFGGLRFRFEEGSEVAFVQRNGTQFVVDGKAFYVNGWNSYWLMFQSVDVDSRHRVREMLKTGAKMGLTVCRTWGFNDGGYHALQTSPGRFDEQAFKALDYVIAEAGQQGIRLLLSLVNNLEGLGGKPQYVKWAWQDGVGLSSSDDSFFFDPSIRSYFKNYIKTILTRKNTITGIEYRNDPTVFGWELINEPRCMSDPSGDTLQEWIEEMSAFVKLIDKNHLVTVGLEGFYGPHDPKSSTVNPGYWASQVGSDFIRNSKISNIDFTSVHIYGDQWSYKQEFEDQLKFVSKWMLSHIEDGDEVLHKPVLFSEYGLSQRIQNFSASDREKIHKTILDIIYKSAKRNKSGAGTLIWQFLVDGINEFSDEYGIVPGGNSSTYSLLVEQSCRLAKVKGWPQQDVKFKQVC
ncbi:mannan endo-1,4-beta-mannosidase 2-like isoform X2 [Lotus japonicus]|uniref:mannan endo-1,4-beta-mannosidase 2-like isoform X2 n=1 Tax=Lotus japonicus TaxID=34305 RepID=UPI002582D2EC|nr:mannan endo-1,4-beta-mannosidase 2-like isoform X2 [Lotus japonicus]